MWTQSGSGRAQRQPSGDADLRQRPGLEFRRTIAVDDNYLFTIKDEVVNKSDKAVSLFPFALISRHGTPKTLGYYILHEGLIGKFGDESLKEVHLQDDRRKEDQHLQCHQCLARHYRQILGQHRCCCRKPTRM